MKDFSRLLVLPVAVVSTLAMASAYQALPEIRERLTSNQACLDFLRRAAANDASMASAETIGADGVRQTVTVEAISDGVERLGRNRAHYAAKMWTVNGWPRPDLRQIQYRANWELHSYECRGRMLISRISNGFTSETYQPMQ